MSEAQTMRVDEALSFLSSVIKSGEPWTPECTGAVNDGRAELAALRAENETLKLKYEAADMLHKAAAQSLMRTDGFKDLLKLTEENERLRAACWRALEVIDPCGYVATTEEIRAALATPEGGQDEGKK